MSEPVSRVVWTGRGTVAGEGGLDGWSTSPEQLVERLEGADELVVHDPLSFPWRHLPSRHRAIPVTLTLPDELDADGLLAALGQPVLRHLTTHDRVRIGSAEAREALAGRLGLPDSVWDDADADAAGRRAAKDRLYEQVGVVRDMLRTVLPTDEKPLLGFLDRARELAGPVAALLGAESADYAMEPAGADVAPHALVVRLDDGGQPRDERVALLGRAAALLHPGGRLVLLGHAVTAPGAAANPSIAEITEELGEAFGGLVHVDELRSAHWRGDTLTRGVVIGATSLRVGVV